MSTRKTKKTTFKYSRIPAQHVTAVEACTSKDGRYLTTTTELREVHESKIVDGVESAVPPTKRMRTEDQVAIQSSQEGAIYSKFVSVAVC